MKKSSVKRWYHCPKCRFQVLKLIENAKDETTPIPVCMGCGKEFFPGMLPQESR